MKYIAAVPKEIIVENLEDIRNQHDGKLRPVDVVEAARPATAPLHPLFTWDNKKAAEEYRLWQAREVIREVVVEIKGRTVAKYHNVQVIPRESSYYQAAEVIVTLPDEFERAVAALLSKFNAARRALEDLKYIGAAAEQPDRLALIAVALEAFNAAGEAVKRIQ
jgi:hypothetical protein